METNLYAAKAILESFDLNIEFCESSLDAIERIKQGEAYDVIFIDCIVLEKDAILVAKALRDVGYNHLIVALTTDVVKVQEEMFVSNGFSGSISKPININHLNSYLTRFIKDKRTVKVSMVG